MKQIILNVPDQKYPFLMELLRNLNFVNVQESGEEKEPTKKEILEDLTESVQEMKLIRAGKLKAKPIQQLLDEL
ncbi:hypothetical protein [Leptospira santarosai]|uniref:Uncharacterized protein n=1 Tax=Leptospira santarosai serovar Shermani str. LT 821 TaxID=758847 RepID=K8Y2H4_9LEPT|nr:hypothetical protein [Leptospira santarosai]EKT84897.1 hypothetical protein LSS_20346 [Leptospira santarosai serovar Shermani str. LT 821]EPG83860.1 hypothetical protein LEP1GSC048_0924 [Leptospira santarosai serovar Shermani str. 1342KT]